MIVSDTLEYRNFVVKEALILRSDTIAERVNRDLCKQEELVSKLAHHSTVPGISNGEGKARAQTGRKPEAIRGRFRDQDTSKNDSGEKTSGCAFCKNHSMGGVRPCHGSGFAPFAAGFEVREVHTTKLSARTVRQANFSLLSASPARWLASAILCGLPT